MSDKTFSRRLIDGITMFVVTALSLLLLVYVGFGEGHRSFEQFHIDKVTAQGRIVQNTIESYLRAGLPLNQYVGFATLVEPMVQIEDIDGMVVYNQAGRQMFVGYDKTAGPIPPPPDAIKTIRDTTEVIYGADQYQIVLPLRTRFETVGSLVVVSPVAFVNKRMSAAFQPLLYVTAALSIAFAAFVMLTAPFLARWRGPWLQVGYSLTFLIMAGAVVGTLISLYSDGVQGKAKASAATLSQRLGDIAEFNLRVRDFEGIDRVFNEYRQLNPEIREAALIVDGTILIDTDGRRIGKAWSVDSHDYEYKIDLTRPGQLRQIGVAVAVPRDVVYRQIERSVRNFAALFVATAFLAGLFLQVASSMQRLRMSGDEAGQFRVKEEAALVAVKPIFFLAVFLENLTYSFLPTFMQDAAIASGMSKAFASAPFTAYYLCFALSLIPAGHFAERFGPRLLIWSGMILAGASVLSLALPLGILPIIGLRALAGIGQGMLFIGIQNYILAVSSPEKKTQGAAIIVFGFQGGMISGMAIGSLLVNYLHPQGVFVLSGVIGFLTAVYAVLLVPRDVLLRPVKNGLAGAIRRVATELRIVVHSGEFLKTMLCIGVPAKAILTGTITFALPLILVQQGYAHEEIGQIIMLYGIGVVAASGYISRLVDRTGNSEAVLFWGAAISGVGLLLIGMMGSELLHSDALRTASVVCGVMIVGVAHGFINAPVVTHVAHSQLAARIGTNPVTTTYRFLERIGYVAGPFVVGQMFLVWGQTPEVIGWIGAATVSLGVLFILRATPPNVGVVGPELTR
jgi:MFS family permease